MKESTGRRIRLFIFEYALKNEDSSYKVEIVIEKIKNNIDIFYDKDLVWMIDCIDEYQKNLFNNDRLSVNAPYWYNLKEFLKEELNEREKSS